MVDLDVLAKALTEAPHADNALDVLVEIALFVPDDRHAAIRANSAGTKVIYTDHAGKDETFWAGDWTIAGRRSRTIRALRAHLKDIQDG